MPAIPRGPLGPAETLDLAGRLRERLRSRVGLEVWTRPQDALPAGTDETKGEENLLLMRQIASLHPALVVTAYDMQRFAQRAEAAGIDQSPTTVIRGSGHSIELVGTFYGSLFMPFIDLVSFASIGATPLAPDSLASLLALEADVRVEAFVSPFDPMSPALTLLLGAIAFSARRVRVRVVEASQYPQLAARRLVTTVPVIWIDDRRFEGMWDEDGLVEQILRVARGGDEPVIRDRVVNAEYLSQEAARARLEAAPVSAEAEPGSGLVLPSQA